MQNEMNSDDLSPADRELEAALTGMRPARATTSRDELLFKAGAASVRWRMRTWQSLAAALLVATSVSIFMRVPAGNERLVPTSQMPIMARTQPQWPPADACSALALHQAVLAKGIDGLPDIVGGGSSGPALTPHSLMLR